MKFYLGNIKLPVVKCNAPKFSSRNGKTWDSHPIRIDGKETKMYADSTWGHNAYFQYGEENKWFRVKMYSTIEMDAKGESYDLDLFADRSNLKDIVTKEK